MEWNGIEWNGMEWNPGNTFKKAIKDEGKSRKRSIEVQGKIWSRRHNDSGLPSKKTTSP